MNSTDILRVGQIGLWSVAIGAMLLISSVLLLRTNGYELLSVQTNSMAPTVRAGEAVMIDVARRDVKIGDIVSFTSPTNARVVITHRVVSVDWQRGTFIARGDNSDMTDRPVPLENVRGTLVHALPFAGYGLNAMRHPLGVVLAVYVPAFGIIASEVRRLTQHFAGRPVGHRRHVRYTLQGRAH